MDGDIGPMRHMYTHEHPRETLVVIDQLIFQFPVSPHGEKIDAVGDVVDNVKEGFDRQKEGKPRGQVLLLLHIRGEGGGTLL